MLNPEGPLGEHASHIAGIAVVGTTGASYLAGWLATSVEVPIGVLVLLFVFILIPTGDLIRLVSELIDSLRPGRRRRVDARGSEDDRAPRYGAGSSRESIQKKR